jgi:hypothetical protein
MPCNFIASCFFLDSPWNRDPECAVVNPAEADLQQPQPAQPAHDDVWQLNPDQHQPQVEQPHVNNMAATAQQQQAHLQNGQATPADNPVGLKGLHALQASKPVKTFRAYLPGSCHRTYSCVHCRAHLANHDELISKSFQGSQGRAYLFNSVVNIGCGPAEERVLLTGLHAVADIFCDCCKTTLGWKYEQAFESSQKYKEGKYIIELAHMIKENGWENES